jgi:ubiquinone/menaquinone biosynthesis C-methylase UbiE
MRDTHNYYQARFVFDARRDLVWKEICRFLQERYIAAQSAILEIGAGYCHFINHIDALERHALDISHEVRRYASQGVVSHIQSCTAMEGIDDDYFDVVFASNVFEHLVRDEVTRSLAEIKRVLKNNGQLIIIQPNFKYCVNQYFDDYTHLQIFTHIGLSDLLIGSGFTIIDVKPRFLPFSMKSHLPAYPWLVRLYLLSPFKPFAGQMLIVAKI